MNEQNVRYILESIDSAEKHARLAIIEGDHTLAESLIEDLIALKSYLAIEVKKLLDKEAA